MGKAKAKAKGIQIQLTPMVKFYLGVAGVVVAMVAVYVLAVVPMFKTEEDLDRQYRSKVSEYEEILGLFEGREADQTIESKKSTIAIFDQEMGRLSGVFPKAPEITGTDPGIFVVEEYYQKADRFLELLSGAGMTQVTESDFLPDPSGSLASQSGEGGMNVSMEIHKMDSVIAISENAVRSGIQSIGEFKVTSLSDEGADQDPNIAVVPLSFTLSCNCRALTSLLYGLDHDPKFFFAVQSISIQAPEEAVGQTTEGPALTVRMTVLSPYLKPVQTEQAPQEGGGEDSSATESAPNSESKPSDYKSRVEGLL